MVPQPSFSTSSAAEEFVRTGSYLQLLLKFSALPDEDGLFAAPPVKSLCILPSTPFFCPQKEVVFQFATYWPRDRVRIHGPDVVVCLLLFVFR